MDYLVTTPRGTYRIDLSAEDAGDLIALLDYYVSKSSASGPGPLRALLRQQVLAELGRATLPEDKDNPFPPAAIVLGDEDSGGAFTRGWLPWQITEWQNARMAARTQQEQPDATAAAEAATAAPAETEGVEAADTSGAAGDGDTGSENSSPPTNNAPARGQWEKGTRQWVAAGAADERIVIVTSRGVAVPSGWVLSPQQVSAEGVLRFINWHWRRKPNGLPQMWFTAEAMDHIGLPTEDADEKTVKEIVAQTFDCRVSWHQSGYFTCRWGGNESEGRSAQLVFMPWMIFDPASARPNDLGVAGTIGTDTLLPDSEDQAVPILAERIAWLASLGDGIVPASRWGTPGATLADVKRRASSVKSVKACPFPADVAATRTQQVDPDLHLSKRPHHKNVADYLKVETDQRAAYLASAEKLQFGYGEPIRVEDPDVGLLEEQKKPFGLWRVTTAPGKDLGVHRRLPMPLGNMDWDEASTFWTTTRGVEHLMAPIENGGAGLAPAELGITAAWLWPYQHQLLRGWAGEIKKRLTEAAQEGRVDRTDMLKAMYKAYLGRMASDKWSGLQRHHQQPAMAAAIRADTRFRAMSFAVNVADLHGLYPTAADVDAWIYWVTPDFDRSALSDSSGHFGKYRIKAIEHPDGSVEQPEESVVRQ